MKLGADYLQKRAALQTALVDLADLARASKAEDATLATLISLGQSLNERHTFGRCCSMDPRGSITGS